MLEFLSAKAWLEVGKFPHHGLGLKKKKKKSLGYTEILKHILVWTLA